MYMQTEDDSLEVRATCIGNHVFRVEADGVIMDVTLAVYSQVNDFFCMHW